MNVEIDNGPFADGFENKLRLTITGNFQDAGIAEIHFAGHDSEFVVLPKTEWGALAVLAAAKLKSPMSVGSFLTANQLAMQLAKRDVIDLIDAQSATRIVHRLRKRLNQTATAQHLRNLATDEIDSIAYRLVRHRTNLGYSLGLDAANVSLTIVQREQPADTNFS
jgi:hypothetical protein